MSNGFSYKVQTDELFIVMVYCMYPNTYESTFSLILTLLTATYFSEVRYGLVVLKLPLNPNQSVNFPYLSVDSIWWSRCLGSTQHLKTTHGGGYVLEVDVLPSTADLFDDDAVATQHKNVSDTICGWLFTDAKCTEQFGRHAVYQVPQTSVQRLSDVFAALQQSMCYNERFLLFLS